MRRRRLYLDTMVYSLLSERAHSRTATGLQNLVDEGVIEVLGSFELLGEFVPLATKNLGQYERIIDLFWSLCGRSVLQPWNEVIRSEIRKRNRLSYSEAYLGVDVVNFVRRLSRDKSAFEEWSDRVRERKEKYASSMTTAAERFEQVVQEKWGPREACKFASELTIDRKRIQDWGRDLLLRPDPERHGLSCDEETWPDISALPCASAYTAITLALRRKRHENRRKDQGNDYYDTMHYVHGSFAGELFTEDKGLRHAGSLIEWRPVETLGVNQLLTLVDELQDSLPRRFRDKTRSTPNAGQRPRQDSQ